MRDRHTHTENQRLPPVLFQVVVWRVHDSPRTDVTQQVFNNTESTTLSDLYVFFPSIHSMSLNFLPFLNMSSFFFPSSLYIRAIPLVQPFSSPSPPLSQSPFQPRWCPQAGYSQPAEQRSPFALIPPPLLSSPLPCCWFCSSWGQLSHIWAARNITL